MTLRSALLFLVGDRRSILEIAQSRWPLVIGPLLVLSGGLARNYDGACLPAEWPVLTHGLGASIGNSFLLFGLVYLAAVSQKGERPRFWPGYLSFLGPFWMTSPMAWLYAIPYERFMTPVEAIEANLWTLAFVSVWRVLLIARVLSVLYRAAFVPVFFLVMLFADVVFFAAAVLMPKPVIDFMGGLQHAPEDTIISGTAFVAGQLTLLTAPVWLIGSLIAARWFKPAWCVPVVDEHRGISRPLISAVVLSLLAWIPILSVTQPEQDRRFRAERLLRAGDVEVAFKEMSLHPRDAYPPIWDPPPRLGYKEQQPLMYDIRRAIASDPPAEWVRRIYLDKSWRHLLVHNWNLIRRRDLGEAIESIADTAVNSPEQIGGTLRETLALHADHDPRLSEEQRALLRRTLESLPPQPPGVVGGS